MTLQSKLTIAAAAALTASLDLGVARAPLDFKHVLDLADGTGAAQADLLWHDQRTLAASGSESLDLAGGSLTDALGTALTFARVKGLIVAAAAGNTTEVLVGGAATNAWASWVDAADNEVVVRPGGVVALLAPGTGYAVTADTGDLLQIANSSSGTSVTYDIVIIGASA
jgi:hypothetical protein